MKIKRYKKVNKYLTFYRNHYGFHQPYQVLIDGTFCQRALKNKVNIREQLPKYLGDQVKVFTTVCIINETQNLGRAVSGAFLIVKQFNVRKCGHTKKPVSASECILSMVGPSNSEHLIVATTDMELTEKLREIPGCPLLYLKLSSLNLEQPSKVSLESGQEVKKKHLGSDETDMERLKQLKEEILGQHKDEPKIRKKKGPKGPNPLSCKKKKKKPENPMINKDQTSKSNVEENKRKRKRKKIPKNRKIVQQVLESFDRINSGET